MIRRAVQSAFRLQSLRAQPLFSQRFKSDGEKGAAINKFELKDAKGVRLSGEEYCNLVREQLEIKEDQKDWQVPLPAFKPLCSEYDAVIKECKDYRGKHTSALAEIEKMRRLGLKQVEDTKQFAVQGICEDIIEVADILDLAVASEAKLKTMSSEMKSLFDGVKMTKTKLLKTFTKHGLRPSNPIGEKFDANLHEAVFQVPKEQAKQEVGHVEQVVKIGYILHGRPIRPAQVGVVKE